MAKIKSEKEYNVVMERIEELLRIVNNKTSIDDKDSIELDLLSNLVEEYEDEHYPIGTPSLAEIIKLRMYEMHLTQKGLAELIGISPSRISEILSGKSEPTYQVARSISKNLNIDASIVLDV
jgi:HTH-type transcriptional regulator/antitoxin HigA